jgi:hypothetical protein
MLGFNPRPEISSILEIVNSHVGFPFLGDIPDMQIAKFCVSEEGKNVSPSFGSTPIEIAYCDDNLNIVIDDIDVSCIQLNRDKDIDNWLAVSNISHNLCVPIKLIINLIALVEY